MNIWLYLSLLLGLFIEDKSLGNTWTHVIIKMMLTCVVTIPIMLDSSVTSETSDFPAVPFTLCVIGMYALVSVVWKEDKVNINLSEGITLVQCVAFIYFLVDFSLYFGDMSLLSFMLIIAYPFTLFAVYHAFSKKKHSRKSKLILSIGSSIMMLIFATEHIFAVVNMELFPFSTTLEIVATTLQYFFLGISAIYIVQNVTMLLDYFPGNGHHYQKEHREEIKKLNEKHINRYSDIQISPISALLTITCTAGIYYLNYLNHWVPRSTAVLLTFWVISFRPYQRLLKRIDKK